MAAVSRARQRAAIAALLATVPGLSHAYTYEQDEQTPLLRGTTYAEVLGSAVLKESQLSTGLKKQEVTWAIRVVQWTTDQVQTGDNASRATLEAQFETVLDNIEAVLRANYKLLDSQGAGNPVANKFGMDFETFPGRKDWNGDGARLEAFVFPQGFVIQS